MLPATSTNSALRATKSVSVFISRIDAALPSSDHAHATSPSAVTLLSRLAKVAAPLALSQSKAISRSPSTSGSFSAFLQSVMGAPVRARRSLIAAMVAEAKWRGRGDAMAPRRRTMERAAIARSIVVVILIAALD